MSSDNSAIMYAAPPNSGSGLQPPWGMSRTKDLPSPEEMRRIALESAVIQDLLKRVQELEKKVKKLEKRK